jgi:uncharacterized protein YneF (UPF0154 family)
VILSVWLAVVIIIALVIVLGIVLPVIISIRWSKERQQEQARYYRNVVRGPNWASTPRKRVQ